MSDLFGLQLETVEAIIVALGTSFVGTGTVALIVKIALGKVTRTMTQKVLLAEERNELTSQQAEQTIKALTASETILKAQVDSLKEEIDKLIRSQNQTNRNVQSLLDEYKARDEQIKNLIVQEFGDDLE